jgi:hypothetical protein
MRLNDLNIYPIAPVPATPAAGEVFTDLTFGTTLLRVTDETDGPSFANAYSAIYDSFNKDSTRFSYVDTVAGVPWTAELDVGRFAVTNKQKVFGNRSVIWSHVDPSVFYSFAGMVLWQYSFKTDAWTQIRDFSKDFPGQTSINNRGVSWINDARFHISFTDGSNVAIYDRLGDKLLGPVPFATAQAVFPALQPYDWGKTTMDGSGEYVVIATGPAMIYNLQLGKGLVTGFGQPGNQYGDVHMDFGPGGMVANAGGIGTAAGGPNDGIYPMMIQVVPANLTTYLTKRRRIGPRCLWGIDTHSSFRDGKWNTLSYDAGVPFGADSGVTPIFNAEIFQLAPNSPPDGSINRRLVRHYSNPSQFSDSGVAYWAACKGSTSQDSRMLIYNSTYGNARGDVYLANLD